MQSKGVILATIAMLMVVQITAAEQWADSLNAIGHDVREKMTAFTAKHQSEQAAKTTPSEVATGIGRLVTIDRCDPERPDKPCSGTDKPAIVTGIRGVVTLGPMCAGPARPDTCPDKPYPNATIPIWARRGYCDDHNLLGALHGCYTYRIAEVHSDSQGEFVLPLPAGTYSIYAEGGDYPRRSSQTIEVIDGQVTSVKIKYDSGIR